MHFIVTGYKGFETVLFHEVRRLLENIECKVTKQYGGVAIDGELDAAYTIILNSRLANRVFYPLKSFKVDSEDHLYDAVKSIAWDEHMDATGTLAVSSSLSRSVMTHTQYAALKVKDGIVDYFKEKEGVRPSVDKNHPDCRLHLNIRKQTGELSLDLSGSSLHMRGYRLEHTGAPLKEHLAASLLAQTQWMNHDYDGLIDPMCGSGTFVIEAAMMKANIPPALTRDYFGFQGWKQHQPEVWETVKETAEANIDVSKIPQMTGYDKEPKAVSVSRQNAERAGLGDFLDFKVKSLYQLNGDRLNNLIICNPPYDERLQAEEGIGNLYSQMGKIFSGFSNSDCFILSGNADLVHRLRLNRISKKPLKNGPLDCLFIELDTGDKESESSAQTEEPTVNAGIYGKIASSNSVNTDTNEPEESKVRESKIPQKRLDEQEQVQPLINRINKNLKHLKRWAKRNNISCYRIYDADLPEFSFALDVYQNALDTSISWYHMQEYQAPKNIPPEKAEQRIKAAANAVRRLFALSDDQLILKVRKKQKGSEQYEKQDSQAVLHTVKENHADLLINLTDYLDTGLFLDHRLTREWVYKQSNQKNVLNLFCYTGSVSVYAALGGANKVLSVDMSNTYLKWTKENLLLNDCGNEEQYPMLRADCIDLLEHPHKYELKEKFDLIFLDPPSFSNSKKMTDSMDIQRDHAQMIQYAVHLLAEGGRLLFSTNRKGFKLNADLEKLYDIIDITAQTVSEDYKRRPKFHQCWLISKVVY